MQHLIARTSASNFNSVPWKTNKAGIKGKYLFLFDSLFLSLSVSLSLCLYIFLSIFLSLFLYLYLYLSIPLYLSLFPCHSLSQHLPLLWSVFLSVSDDFGFGLLDAYALTSTAKNWTNVGPHLNCSVQFTGPEP